MKSKKLLALGLATAMSVSALAGCGSKDAGTAATTAVAKETAKQEATKAPSAAAPTTQAAVEETKAELTFPLAETQKYTAMGVTVATDFGLEKNPLLNKYLEEANIEIEWVLQATRNDYKEKGNLMLASGDYPDIVFKMPGMDENQKGMDGIYIPLEDMIKEHMPNLCALMDERNAWAVITASDGHIYSLPQVSAPQVWNESTASLYIQAQWLENLGLEMPKTMDELYTVLKAFKEQDANGNGDPNDEVPLVMTDAFIYALMPYIGDGLHYLEEHVTLMGDELVFYPYTDGFKDFLNWMNILYQDGILHKDCFTMTADQRGALGKSGDVYGLYIATTAATNTLPEYAPQYECLLPLSDTPMPLNPGVTAGAMMLTDTCENPEAILKFFDYFYSEEGGMESAAGLKGIGWEDNGDGTYTSFSKNFGSLAEYTYAGHTAAPRLEPMFYYTGTTDNGKKASYWKYSEEGFISKGYYMPILNFNEEETERMSVLATDIRNEVKTYLAAITTGTKSLDDSWDEFQSTLKDMGADEYLELYKAAYARATAK